MYIWSVIRRGITPEINAVGTIIVIISIHAHPDLGLLDAPRE